MFSGGFGKIFVPNFIIAILDFSVNLSNLQRIVKPIDMKHLVTIFTIILFSQMAQSQKNNDSYTTLWKQVEKLENEALTKSALKIVTTITQKPTRKCLFLSAFKNRCRG